MTEVTTRPLFGPGVGGPPRGLVTVAVPYDLGGGTFDASLLKMTGHLNEVVISEGIQRLGGDDFDETILKIVLKESKLRKIDATVHDVLREECCRGAQPTGPDG